TGQSSACTSRSRLLHLVLIVGTPVRVSRRRRRQQTAGQSQGCRSSRPGCSRGRRRRCRTPPRSGRPRTARCKISTWQVSFRFRLQFAILRAGRVAPLTVCPDASLRPSSLPPPRPSAPPWIEGLASGRLIVKELVSLRTYRIYSSWSTYQCQLEYFFEIALTLPGYSAWRILREWENQKGPCSLGAYGNSGRGPDSPKYNWLRRPGFTFPP